MRNALPVSLSVAVVLSLLAGCGARSADEAGDTSTEMLTTTAPADATTTTATRSTPAPTTTVRTTVPGSGTGTDGQVGGDSERCSAEGSPGQVDPRPGVPDAVRETRRAIIDAAVACDYGALAELAAAGDDSFTYSFGDEGDPAGHWRRLEAEAAEDPPLRYLVELLRAPHGRREVEGQRVYAWPSAFAYEDWSEVPEADRAALRALYGEEDFAFFERFGGYVGYRIGIAEDGEWLYFVAGD